MIYKKNVLHISYKLYLTILNMTCRSAPFLAYQFTFILVSLQNSYMFLISLV